MKFMIDGTPYDFDESTLTVKEARLIKQHTGMGLKTFADASKGGDPDALVAILFLAKRRAGEAVRWQDFDDLNLAALETLDETVKDAGAAEAPGEDPLWPDGETLSSA